MVLDLVPLIICYLGYKSQTPTSPARTKAPQANVQNASPKKKPQALAAVREADKPRNKRKAPKGGQ